MKSTFAIVLCLAAAATAHQKGFEEKIEIVSEIHKRNNARRTAVFQHTLGLDSNGDRTRDRRVVAELPLLRIPVKFHVVHHNTKGKVPLKNVLLQIDVLNNAFRGKTVDESPQDVQDHFQAAYGDKNVAVDAKIEFFLSGKVNYVNKKEWYQCGESDALYDEIRMGTTIEPTKYMNIFTCHSDTILGSSVFPDTNMKPTDKRWSMMLSHYTLPGFTADYTGDTATHEIGHYFGLYHTFYEGSGTKCKSSGDDGIGDTPFEDGQTYGCPIENSCNKGDSSKHSDPVWNFMDYTDDSCMWRFSPKQAVKMHSEIEQYKPTLYKASKALSAKPTTVPTKPADVVTRKPTTKPVTTKPTEAPYDGTPGPSPAPSDDDDYTYEETDDDAGYSGYWKFTDDDFISNYFDDDGSYSGYGYAYSADDDFFDYADYDDDSTDGNSEAAFSAMWGWTDWTSFNLDEQDEFWADGAWFNDTAGSGFSGLTAADFNGTKVFPGSCAGTDVCGIRNFDRECSCEASCDFFHDCCADYHGVCDAVKVDRKAKASASKATKSTQRLKAEAADTTKTSSLTVSLTVPLKVELKSLTDTELVEIKDKVQAAVVKVGGFKSADVVKVALKQDGVGFRRAAYGPIVATIYFKEAAAVNVAEVSEKLNAAIKANKVSLQLSVDGKKTTVLMTESATVVTEVIGLPKSASSHFAPGMVGMVAAVATLV